MKLDRFDLLLAVGSVTGAAGCACIWPPLALLFIAAVCLVLAAIIDYRSAACPQTLCVNGPPHDYMPISKTPPEPVS